uniref:EGF-like domain-containing protein n=1 Tax=Elaeophora elaphi TaxID=1147741 RepID=A0A0R3RNT9_9BILA
MYSSSTRWDVLAQQRKAFVNPQSECRIKCLNGGFCAYLVDDPSIHTCLCLLNVYYGDRCQYAGTSNRFISSGYH